MSDEDLERATELVEELVTTDRERVAFEMAVQTRDGEENLREDHLALLKDEDGQIQGTVGVLRDIEERKQRERELERYASLVEATGDAVYALDAEGRFTFSNEAHQEIVDRPESAILGQHAAIALTDESVENGQALIEELLGSDRRCGTYEMDVLRPDGERIPTENHVALLTDDDGEFRGTVGVLRDISDRLERERELERQNERLEEFVSIASHDLRNPLNLAQGYMEMVEAECETPYTDNVTDALGRMEQLIEDTLTWARQGATVDDRERIDLAEVAPTCWAAVGSDEGQLSVIDDVSVEGDPGRVRRVLENLLRNAVEHGGDDVTVRVGALPDGFYVEDDGPGIPADARESIFDAGVTTGAEGTGFGLAIIEEIVEAHGWEIGVAESEAGGARFEITGTNGS